MKKILIIALCIIVLIPAAFIGARYFNHHNDNVKKVSTLHKHTARTIKVNKKQNKFFEGSAVNNGGTHNSGTSGQTAASKASKASESAGSSENTATSTPEVGATDKASKGNNKAALPDSKLMTLLGKIPGKYSIGIKNLTTGKETFIASPNITETTQMQSASLIKLFIMLEAFNKIEEGKLSYNQETKNLLEAMITKSDNTAANTLIDRLGMKNINKTIQKNGFAASVLNRRMLDYKSLKAGIDNYTCGKDIINLFTKIDAGTLISKKYSSEMLALLKRQQINTKIPVLLPPNTVVAHKTGELPPDSGSNSGGVENDAGIVYGAKGKYIISFLINGISDTAGARKAIQDISRSVYEYYSK